MYESGYYPPGAWNDPRAPWNQSDPEPVSQDIGYSCIMRRTANVETTAYTPGSEEKEWDGDGYIAVRDGDDFSDTDWLGEYKEQYLTPLQLIELLRDTAKMLADGKIPPQPVKYWKRIIADCDGWEIEDEYTEEV